VTRDAIGRPGYTLLAAATVSRLATNTAPVALVLLVIARTRDPRLAGLLVAAFTVPTLIAGPVLGAYLDQLQRKRLLFAASQLVLAADLAAVLLLAGRAPGWLLAALTLVAGATAPALTGGYSSLVPLVIPPAALGRANSLDAASYGVGGIAGPALVSALSGAFGVGVGFGALVATTAAGLPLVLLAPMPVAANAAPSARESLPAAIADGLRLLRQSRELLAVTMATTAGQFFQGPLPVLLPLLAIALGRPATAGGWLLTTFSVGGLAGALASDRLIARWSTRLVLLGSLAGLGALLAVLAAPLSFAACLVVAAFAGVADGPALAATLTVRQGNVPRERYAQTLATASSLKIAAYSAGSALAGVLIGVVTIRQLMLGLAGGQLLSAVPLLLARRPRSVMSNEPVVSAATGHCSPTR
jgi:MFS family permease